jgi:hypothetical protein
MTDRRESHCQDEYRLIFLDAESRAIFVDPGGEQLHLPRVAIPRGSRTARDLQQAIKDKWRVDAIILEFIPSAVGNFTAAIVEIEASAHYEGLTQACIDDISQDELDSESRALAESIWPITNAAFSSIGRTERLAIRSSPLNTSESRFCAMGARTVGCLPWSGSAGGNGLKS